MYSALAANNRSRNAAGSRRPSAGGPIRPSGGDPIRPSGGGPIRPSAGGPIRPSGGDPIRPSGGGPIRPSGGGPIRPSAGGPIRPAAGGLSRSCAVVAGPPQAGSRGPSAAAFGRLPRAGLGVRSSASGWGDLPNDASRASNAASDGVGGGSSPPRRERDVLISGRHLRAVRLRPDRRGRRSGYRSTALHRGAAERRSAEPRPHRD